MDSVVQDKGNTVVTHNEKSIDECATTCEATKNCYSFTYCSEWIQGSGKVKQGFQDAGKCLLQDKVLKGTELLSSLSGAPNYDPDSGFINCRSNYRTCISGIQIFASKILHF